MHDHVRVADQACGLDRQKLRIARSGADQMHHAGFLRRGAPERIQALQQRPARSRRVALVRGDGGGTAQGADPEFTPRLEIPDHRFHGIAQIIRRFRENARPRRHHALDGGAQVARQDRRGAAGGKRHRHRAPVDHRRRVEIAEIGAVDDIDQRPRPLGAPRQPGGKTGFLDRDEDQRRAIECRGRHARAGVHRHVGLHPGWQTPLAAQRMPDHGAGRSAEQAQLVLGGLAAADDHNFGPLQGQGGHELIHDGPPQLAAPCGRKLLLSSNHVFLCFMIDFLLY